MKKINFTADVLPHLIAVAVFLIITVFFFSPVFFENKALQQYDIQQFVGSSKAIADFREETGKEALWTNSMFSGMPAYLISVQWGNQVIGSVKTFMALFLPHPSSPSVLKRSGNVLSLIASSNLINPYTSAMSSR